MCPFKAGLAAKRFFRKEGIESSKTFVLVVPFEVFLLLVGKLVSDGWHVHPANIFTAFLNETIDGELDVS